MAGAYDCEDIRERLSSEGNFLGRCGRVFGDNHSAWRIRRAFKGFYVHRVLPRIPIASMLVASHVWS